MTNRRPERVLLKDLVETAKGLAHPTRLRLLGMLATGELCAANLDLVAIGLREPTNAPTADRGA